MAFPTPNVTKGTCTGASDLITQLTSHWSGTSTKFELSTGVAYDAGDSLCIEPISDPGASSDWQINIRRVSTTAFKTQLDPSGTITDAGSTSVGPTGASSLSSYEDDWSIQSSAAPLTWFLCEWDDAVLLLVRDTTNTYHYRGFHTGRVFNSPISGISPGVSDGFGNLCGSPNLYAYSGSSYWFGPSVSGASLLVSGSGTRATDWSRTLDPYPSSSSGANANCGAYYYPTPVAIFGASSGRRYIGSAKYVYATVSDTPDTRLENPSTGTDRWLHLSSSTSPSLMVIPWPDATSPFP